MTNCSHLSVFCSLHVCKIKIFLLHRDFLLLKPRFIQKQCFHIQFFDRCNQFQSFSTPAAVQSLSFDFNSCSSSAWAPSVAPWPASTRLRRRPPVRRPSRPRKWHGVGIEFPQITIDFHQQTFLSHLLVYQILASLDAGFWANGTRHRGWEMESMGWCLKLHQWSGYNFIIGVEEFNY